MKERKPGDKIVVNCNGLLLAVTVVHYYEKAKLYRVSEPDGRELTVDALAVVDKVANSYTLAQIAYLFAENQ